MAETCPKSSLKLSPRVSVTTEAKQALKHPLANLHAELLVAYLAFCSCRINFWICIPRRFLSDSHPLADDNHTIHHHTHQYLPSGKRLHNYGKIHHIFHGKSSPISTGPFSRSHRTIDLRSLRTLALNRSIALTRRCLVPLMHMRCPVTHC